MLDDPLAFMSAHPASVVIFVFAAAVLEYVFPPFWGDTVMLVGCFLAGLDRVDALHVFAAALLGSCLGAVAAYGIGRRFGAASLALCSRSARARRLAETAERWHARHGSRVLALNRFLPGVRAFFLPLAGIGNMPLRRVLVWSTVSNALYCALLLSVGLAVGASAPDFGVLEGRFRSATVVAGIVAVALLVVLTVVHRLRRRRCCVGS